MKNTFIFIAIVVVLVGGFMLFRGNRAEAPTDTPPPPAEPSAPPPAKSDKPLSVHGTGAIPENTIMISILNDRPEPKTISIPKGTTVYFVNKGTKSGEAESPWPASALHPTHTVYPNSDIEKCETDEANKIFDACKGIAPNAWWSFTFNETGEWRWHDHSNTAINGSITVSE